MVVNRSYLIIPISIYETRVTVNERNDIVRAERDDRRRGMNPMDGHSKRYDFTFLEDVTIK